MEDDWTHDYGLFDEHGTSSPIPTKSQEDPLPSSIATLLFIIPPESMKPIAALVTQVADWRRGILREARRRGVQLANPPNPEVLYNAKLICDVLSDDFKKQVLNKLVPTLNGSDSGVTSDDIISDIGRLDAQKIKELFLEPIQNEQSSNNGSRRSDTVLYVKMPMEAALPVIAKKVLFR